MVTRGFVLGLLLPLILPARTRAVADFRFASHIHNHMVLQKEPAGAVLWGYGTPGATVVVTLHQDQEVIMKKVTPVTAHSDTWMVVLDPLKPGGPYEVLAQQTFGSRNLTIGVHDVLFGDVWLCSGQSNMQMTVSQIFNATSELSDTAAYQSVRILSVSLAQAEQELEEVAAVDLQWSKPTAENLGHGSFEYMSAVCWLFGRYLYDTLQYPIGLISSSWGGTPIEAWSSGRSLKACGVPKHRFIPADSVTGPSEHSVLWNAMIHPLCSVTLKGVIWYQGEANVNFNRDLYSCTFPALIADWRQTFHRGSGGQTERLFPFGFVQAHVADGRIRFLEATEVMAAYLLKASRRESLTTGLASPQCSSFGYFEVSCDKEGTLLTSAESQADNSALDDGFSQIRWHQTADVGYVPNLRMPNTFMAVAMDLGDRTSPFGSIHPRDKQTVAYRLHLGARAVAYGEKQLTFQGPLPEKIELLADKGLLNLTYSQQILVQRQDDRIFEVSCCGDQQCMWLPAPMNTFSTWTLTLNTSSCSGALVAVRYAWTAWPCEYKLCPLYHPSSALPAPPFTAFAADQMPGSHSRLLNDAVRP